jgi:hypothetical protein
MTANRFISVCAGSRVLAVHQTLAEARDFAATGETPRAVDRILECTPGSIRGRTDTVKTRSIVTVHPVS